MDKDKIEQLVEQDLHPNGKNDIFSDVLEEVETQTTGFFKSLFSFGKKVSKVAEKKLDILAEKVDTKLDEIVDKAKDLELELHFVEQFNEVQFKHCIVYKKLNFIYKDTLTKGSYLLGELHQDETWESAYGNFLVIKRMDKFKNISYFLKIDHIDTQDLFLEYPIDTEEIYNSINPQKEQICIQ